MANKSFDPCRELEAQEPNLHQDFKISSVDPKGRREKIAHIGELPVQSLLMVHQPIAMKEAHQIPEARMGRRQIFRPRTDVTAAPRSYPLDRENFWISNCFRIFGRSRRFFKVFGSVWTCSDLFGSIWMRSDAVGCVRALFCKLKKSFDKVSEELEANGLQNQFPDTTIPRSLRLRIKKKG